MDQLTLTGGPGHHQAGYGNPGGHAAAGGDDDSGSSGVQLGPAIAAFLAGRGGASALYRRSSAHFGAASKFESPWLDWRRSSLSRRKIRHRF